MSSVTNVACVSAGSGSPSLAELSHASLLRTCAARFFFFICGDLLWEKRSAARDDVDVNMRWPGLTWHVPVNSVGTLNKVPQEFFNQSVKKPDLHSHTDSESTRSLSLSIGPTRKSTRYCPWWKSKIKNKKLSSTSGKCPKETFLLLSKTPALMVKAVSGQRRRNPLKSYDNGKSGNWCRLCDTVLNLWV